MSSPDTTIEPPAPAAPAGGRHRLLSILSLVFALVLCVPGMPLVGFLLATVVVFRAGRGSGRSRRMAATAIVVGLLFTGAQGFVINFGVQVQRFSRQAPLAAMRAGQDGDLAGFRKQFSGPAAAASDQTIRVFFDAFDAAHGRVERLESASISAEGMTVTFHVQFITERDETVETDFAAVIVAEGLYAFDLISITVWDGVGEPLRFPPPGERSP